MDYTSHYFKDALAENIGNLLQRGTLCHYSFPTNAAYCGEPWKHRPVVVVSVNPAERLLAGLGIQVVPLSSQINGREKYDNVQILYHEQASRALLTQLTTVNSARLRDLHRIVSDQELNELSWALSKHLSPYVDLDSASANFRYKIYRVPTQQHPEGLFYVMVGNFRQLIYADPVKMVRIDADGSFDENNLVVRSFAWERVEKLDKAHIGQVDPDTYEKIHLVLARQVGITLARSGIAS